MCVERVKCNDEFKTEMPPSFMIFYATQCARPRGTAARHGSICHLCSLLGAGARAPPRTVFVVQVHFTLFMHARHGVLS